MEEGLLLIVAIFFFATLFWIRFFTRRDRGEKEPGKTILFAALLGALAAIAAGIASDAATWTITGGTDVPDLLKIWEQDAVLPLASIPIVLSWTLLFASIEELLKFSALFFFARRSAMFAEISDGIFYGIVIGLGFGLLESIIYFGAFGLDASGRILFILTHPALTGIVGYAYGRQRNNKGGSWLIKLFFTLIAVSILHALYNLGIFFGDRAWGIILYWSIVATLYTFLFILYRRAQTFARNVYCVFCGTKNRDAQNFCASCGAVLLR